MKGNLEKFMTALLIAMLLVMPVLASDVPTETHAAPTIWMEPNDLKFETGDTNAGYVDNVGVGYTFTVTVYLNASTPVVAWTFRILFNSAWLECVACVYSGTGGAKSQLFEKSGSPTGFPLFDIGADYVLAAETIFPVAPPYGPANNASSLAYVTFNVTKIPAKGETFTSALEFVADPAETSYTDSDANTWWKNDLTYVLDTPDGAAEFIWSAPPKPWFALDPSETTFDKFTDAVGLTFPVKVIIDNYYDGWGMTNATFCLSYNSTLLNATAVTINTAEWTLVSLVNDNDWVNVTVKDFIGAGYAGDPVLVATITFEVLYQGTSPPDPADYYVESPLAFCDETEVWNHEYTIDDPPEDGWVRIYSMLTLVLPYLAVEPDTITYGPAVAVGEQFTLEIVIKNLHFAWHLAGLDFRLNYCPDLLKVVSMAEGPYFPLFDQGQGTVFVAFDEGTYVTAMDLILPDANVTWPNPLPGADPPEDGTIALITFEIIKQDVSCDPETYTCDLDLYEIMMIDWLGGDVSYDTPQNATYTILGSYEVGRVIDVYTQYPAPYGGQGWNASSDMFWPQKEVILCADVSYNCWPMQQKLVTFTVYDNEGNVWTQLQDLTDVNGEACVSFRMPWPCNDPESLFGVWKVKADVDVACVVITDWLEFHYDYLINIVKVTTDKYYYEHCEWVEVTVEFTSHAQQMYTTSMWVTIHDDLNVPIATTSLGFTIGGAEFCTAKEYVKIFTLHIDKFAAAGEATVYVTPRLYWNGSWVAAGPMASTKIYILPS